MRLLNSIKNALRGIRFCVVFERNFRIQVIVALVAFLLGVLFNISTIEWFVILICSGIVIGLEMVNTTIEKLSNLITETIHPQIKQIKDIAAGAVGLVSIISMIIGFIIFLPKLLLFLKHLK